MLFLHDSGPEAERDGGYQAYQYFIQALISHDCNAIEGRGQGFQVDFTV